MQIKILEKELSSLRNDLLKHRLYQNINSIEDIQVFMGSHVFAVWDFMSLLKSLQIELTTTSTPWVPKGRPLLSRFINEIVLAEESDLNECKVPMSHFEMYIDAMDEVGADTFKIDKLVNYFEMNNKYSDIDENIFPSKASKEFTDFTFQVIATKKPHLIAACFTFGRENLIPDMFIEIVKKLNKASSEKFSKLVYYLDRHIEIDSGEHGPMATNMIKVLCGDDDKKWKECVQVSKDALTKRIRLWDSIVESIEVNQNFSNYS
ncbi:PROBABLE REMNANT OF A TRANSPOSASE GENE PROTEIN [hydrothermal vent metagenome]|uniref:PROBABLE REMNANT OF A TRANSPOSASE GENE PROTEIN n=1 Tax=hydrothermal vent metagenome TaxID=652676 RepID=A0A3B0W5W1_9ZZZZ